MIDTKREKLLRLTELKTPRRVNHATKWRWATLGCRGIKLETIPVGAIMYTTREAYERFTNALIALGPRQGRRTRKTPPQPQRLTRVG